MCCISPFSNCFLDQWVAAKQDCQVNATPKPAARSVSISGPREEQQSISLPSITTAGTLRIPKCRARSATSGFRVSRTVTSQDGQADFLTSSIVSKQQGQPALKTSIFLFIGISISY